MNFYKKLGEVRGKSSICPSSHTVINLDGYAGNPHLGHLTYFSVTRNAISIPPWTNPINDIMGAQRSTIETLVCNKTYSAFLGLKFSQPLFWQYDA